MNIPPIRSINHLPNPALAWARTFSTTLVVCGLALVLLPAPVRAAIALQDAPVGITNSPLTSTSISQPFTVTAGANTLVVILLEKTSTSTGITPTTLTWNGLTLTRAVRAIDTAATYREAAVYYGSNPSAGTANITGTLTGAPVCTYLQAYTLNGVDTTVAPVTGAASSTSGTTSAGFLTCTLNVAANSWAAVGGVLGSKGVVGVSVTGTGGTPNVFYGNDTSADNCAFAFGYISGLSAGSDTIQYSWTVPLGTNPNPTANAFAVAVFAPPAPASVIANPTAVAVWPTQTAQLSASVAGTAPLTNQWYFGSTRLSDGTQGDGSLINGSGTTTLTISNVHSADAGSYFLTTTNAGGGAASTAGVLTVRPFYPSTNLTMTAFEGAGFDWNSTNVWNDGLGGLAASDDAVGFPGSTFEVLPGAQVRNPTVAAYNTFPGVQLKVDGNGSFTNVATTAAPTVGLIKFKGTANPLGSPTTNYFPVLVMAGGELDNGGPATGTGAQTIIVQGTINIVSNTAIYVDSSGNAARPFQIDAFLEGNGSIEYHDFDATLTGGLDITGNTNAFTGTWNIVQGPLVGSGTNSLGTNTIIIGPNGVLETSYPVNNPGSALVLDGQMFLTQTDVFSSVLVGGIPISPGTYSAADLNLAYPANFPAAFPALYGTTETAISGQITVLTTPKPIISAQPQSLTQYPGQGAVTLSVTAGGTPPLSYQWFTNTTVALSDTANRIGSTSDVLTIPNPTVADSGSYTVVVTNIYGAVTSSMAVLTILAPGPAMNFTLDYGGAPMVQPIGASWNTITNWNPGGQAASVSAYQNPGSTFEVVVGSRLRTPAGTNNVIFPDDKLTIDGSGILENDGSASPVAVGELRFKNNNTPATYYFNKLVLNGGQLDIGDNILVVMEGELNVKSTSSVYVDNAPSSIDRSYQVDSRLTGSGDLFWHEFSGALGGADLQVTGTSNTFSGQWIVDQGALVGVGAGSLGTNNLIVGTNGLTAAVETLYDINNPEASFILGANGQMFLHQNDTFKSMSINGVALAPGTYSFAALNSSYPGNFPSSWAQQNGSFFTTGSGQIVVGFNQLSAQLVGGNEVLGFVGTPRYQYALEWTTNLAAPIHWVPVVTNMAGSDGSLMFTNTPSARSDFYRTRYVP